MIFLVGKESGGLRLEMGGAGWVGWVTGDFFFLVDDESGGQCRRIGRLDGAERL